MPNTKDSETNASNFIIQEEDDQNPELDKFDNESEVLK